MLRRLSGASIDRLRLPYSLILGHLDGLIPQQKYACQLHTGGYEPTPLETCLVRGSLSASQQAASATCDYTSSAVAGVLSTQHPSTKQQRQQQQQQQHATKQHFTQVQQQALAPLLQQKSRTIAQFHQHTHRLQQQWQQQRCLHLAPPFLVEDYTPAAVTTYRLGRMPAKLKAAEKELEDCRVCPRDCGVNRSGTTLHSIPDTPGEHSSIKK